MKSTILSFLFTSVSFLSREHWARWARWARRAQTLLFHTLPNVGSIGSRSIVIASIFLSRKADRPKRRARIVHKRIKNCAYDVIVFFVAQLSHRHTSAIQQPTKWHPHPLHRWRMESSPPLSSRRNGLSRSSLRVLRS
jgi:hypothetical protein